MIDNYDSFTYNLVQYLEELGASVEVVRNDKAYVDALLQEEWTHCIVSPGPCTPDEAGISLEVMRRFPEAGIPTLGVCLGHQALAQAFGGNVLLNAPVHGKATDIEHDGRTIFSNLPSPLTVGRYHSLVVSSELPKCFEVSAMSGEVVMAIRHLTLPAEGVQFHPESVLTKGGQHLLANFLGEWALIRYQEIHDQKLLRECVSIFSDNFVDSLECFLGTWETKYGPLKQAEFTRAIAAITLERYADHQELSEKA